MSLRHDPASRNPGTEALMDAAPRRTGKVAPAPAKTPPRHVRPELLTVLLGRISHAKHPPGVPFN